MGCCLHGWPAACHGMRRRRRQRRRRGDHRGGWRSRDHRGRRRSHHLRRQRNDERWQRDYSVRRAEHERWRWLGDDRRTAEGRPEQAARPRRLPQPRRRAASRCRRSARPFSPASTTSTPELGGINGRPMKAETCNLDVTPESSVNCANQFVEKNVVVAIQGVDVAADAALPIWKQAGLVDIAFAAFTTGLNSSRGDAFVTLFDSRDILAQNLIMQQKLGAKSVALVLLNVASSKSYFDSVLKPTADKLGLKVQPFYYYDTTDWTSFAATILSTSPDGVDLPGGARTPSAWPPSRPSRTPASRERCTPRRAPSTSTSCRSTSPRASSTTTSSTTRRWTRSRPSRRTTSPSSSAT